MVSALVALVVSSVASMASIAMIQNSQKSGLAAQSHSDMRILVDSLSSLVADSPNCAGAFFDAGGAKVSIPAGGSTEVDEVRFQGQVFAKKGGQAGALTIEKLELIRPASGSMMQLKIGTRKPQGAYGAPTLERTVLLASEFDSGNRITGCGPSMVSSIAAGKPDLVFELGDKTEQTHWHCIDDMDLQDYCGDADGCRVMGTMTHETYYDQTLSFSFEIHMEQAELSNNVYPKGIYGGTMDVYTHTFTQWYSGSPDYPYYSVLYPWYWVYLSTYTHQYCPKKPTALPPDMTQRGVATPLPAYHFSLMIHPHVTGRFVIRDKP